MDNYLGVHVSLPFVLLLLATIPDIVSPRSVVCSKTYTCMTTDACMERHTNSVTSILFRCGDDMVCCPPVRPKPTRPRPKPRPTPPTLPIGEEIATKFSLKDHPNYSLLPTTYGTCGQTQVNNRISEGTEATPGQFPWMTLLGIRHDDGRLQWGCGGSLINSRYVLTAAHCIGNGNRTINTVRLREHNLTYPDENCLKAGDCRTGRQDCNREGICLLGPPVDIEIEKIISHYNWNNTVKTTLKNDIALLRLRRKVNGVTEKDIVPICLPLDEEQVPTKKEHEIAGWGTTDPDNPVINPVLLKGVIRVVPLEECNVCRHTKQDICPITSSQICAQGSKSVDVCKGDSGSPLMSTGSVETYAIGITSFKSGAKCGEDGIPSIFTKVAAYLKWILDTIEE